MSTTRGRTKDGIKFLVFVRVFFFVESLPLKACQDLQLLPKLHSREELKQEFAECVLAPNRTCEHTAESPTPLDMIQESSGWLTDDRVKCKLKSFFVDCTRTGGKVFGGNNNSTLKLVFATATGELETELKIHSTPICFPLICLSDKNEDIFHGMKVLYRKPHKLLVNLTANMLSPDGQTRLIYPLPKSPPLFPPQVHPGAPEISVNLVLLAISVPMLAILVYFLVLRRTKSKSHTRTKAALLTTANLPSNQITIGKLVGRGSYGAVYAGQYLGKTVAIKALYSQQGDDMQDFQNEVNVLSNLQHPNIVQFIGTSTFAFYGTCVLTEFLEHGDLRQVLDKAKKKELELNWISPSSFSKQTIAIDIISGLAYLHSLAIPILHRDMKSKNILLSKHYVAKIADFGLSRVLSSTSTMTVVGSNLWTAPEVLQSNRYDEKSDIYSFGVVLAELDTQELPYYDLYREEAGERIKPTSMAVAYLVCNERLRPSLSTTCIPAVAQLATECMSARACDRPTAINVLYRLQQIDANCK